MNTWKVRRAPIGPGLRPGPCERAAGLPLGSSAQGWALRPALAATGLDVHLHDLRHTGNTLTADAGANLRELMERMGHASTRAALIYLHSTDERQRKLADAVGELAREELRKASNQGEPAEASGTKVARRRRRAS